MKLIELAKGHWVNLEKIQMITTDDAKALAPQPGLDEGRPASYGLCIDFGRGEFLPFRFPARLDRDELISTILKGAQS